MARSYIALEDGTLVPSIPVPFWYRGWRTLFRWRPGCYQCKIIFKTEEEYGDHYVRCHCAEE